MRQVSHVEFAVALESSDNGSSSTAKKKARTLFKNCMDEKATSTIKEAVQGIEVSHENIHTYCH